MLPSPELIGLYLYFRLFTRKVGLGPSGRGLQNIEESDRQARSFRPPVLPVTAGYLT